MPLCGFNPKMVEGIETFSEGLFEATIERGRENNVSDSSAVQTELAEIRLFLEALEKKFGRIDTCNGSSGAEMIYGIALFAHGLFKTTMENNSDERQLATEYNSNVQRVGQFLEQLESEHQRLKKNNPPEVTMRKAAEWVAENSV
jgi:hypothetical protein